MPARPYMCRIMLVNQTATRAHYDLCRRTDLSPGGRPGSGSKAVGSAALQTATATSDGPSVTFLPTHGEVVGGRPEPVLGRPIAPSRGGPAITPPGVALASLACPRAPVKTPRTCTVLISRLDASRLHKRACQNPMQLYGAWRLPGIAGPRERARQNSMHLYSARLALGVAPFLKSPSSQTPHPPTAAAATHRPLVPQRHMQVSPAAPPPCAATAFRQPWHRAPSPAAESCAPSHKRVRPTREACHGG
jgi:hypothetical protein